jgi:hypothetical protein
MCICWCIEDIIYEKNGILQDVVLLFTVKTECLYSCKWHFLRAILYCPCGRSVCTIFFHINSLTAKIIERKIVLIFSATFVYNICLPKKISARYYHKSMQPSGELPIIPFGF